MTLEGYIDQLLTAARRLKEHGARVDVRGNDLASFVFAEREGRAIELSRTAQETWWVEFWVDAEEAPDHEETFRALEEAVDSATAWLRRSGRTCRREFLDSRFVILDSFTIHMMTLA